eukprot:251340_1
MTDYGSLLEDPSTQNQQNTYYENIQPDPNQILNTNNQQSEDEDDDEDIKDIHRDLFGSDDDDDNTQNKNKTPQIQPENENDMNDNKIISKEYKRSVPEGKKISVSTNLSLSSLPQSSDFEFCILRLPNVIGCETEQFDVKTYVEPSSTSSIENYIRWRTHFDNSVDEYYRETNTKLVYWKDGTKSLFIGKDCYDIDEQILSGNRDFIYAKLPNESNNCGYKLCHGQFIKRLNVKATSQKSYKTLQKNLAKKHERTKGSKQLTAAQRRNNRMGNNNNNNNNKKKKGKRKKVNRKRVLSGGYLEQGAHGGSSDEDGMPKRKRYKRSDSDDESDGSDDESDDNYSDSESDDDEDDDQPIGNRF